MLSILTTATAICLPLFFHGVLFDSYPDSWFVEITSSPKLCSLAAIHAGRIIGMIVVEVKPLTACNQEDSDLLSYATGNDAQVAYILSLGVFKEHRRSGIG
jgi:ribosomal protein S18 acetylase RimI-like enzyme